MRGLTLVLLITAACGPAVATSETGETGATDPGSSGGSGSSGGGGSSSSGTDTPTEATTHEITTSTTGETTGDASSTGAPAPPCSCVVGEECPGELNDCAGPAPCGHVDEIDPDATTCVLELMLTQQAAQFTYCLECGGFETYEGIFHVLGPGTGVDLECHIIDFSSEQQVRNHTIQPPAYFEGCLELVEFAARRNCLLNGFEPGETLPMCEG